MVCNEKHEDQTLSEWGMKEVYGGSPQEWHAKDLEMCTYRQVGCCRR